MKKLIISAAALGLLSSASAFAGGKPPEKAVSGTVASTGFFSQTFVVTSASPNQTFESVSVSGLSSLFNSLNMVVSYGANTTTLLTGTLASTTLLKSVYQDKDYAWDLPAAGTFNVTVSGDAKSAGADFVLKANYVSAITPVPEPESYAMLLAGLGLMGGIARRRSLNK